MFSRAHVVTLLLSFLFVSPLASAQYSQPSSPASAEFAAIEGKVLNADGHPVAGIHVELDDPSTAVPVNSTYTQPDGSFQLSNIPKGNYEVIADSTESEVSNEVSVQSGRPSLELRFPSHNAAPVSPDATVSVVHMLVPSSAQKMYDKAYRAFQKGAFEEADKQLQAALQIDSEYADALTLRGLVLLAKPEASEAQQLLEQAIHVDPDESTAYIALAALYNHQGRFDDAMRASEKGLSLAPKTWQAYLEMAKASIAQNMYNAGLKFVRQAERLGGTAYGEVHLVKACALVPLRLYKDAKYELRASLSYEPQGQVADMAKNLLAKVDAMQSVGINTQH